jgi:hypothetical protein
LPRFFFFGAAAGVSRLILERIMAKFQNAIRICTAGFISTGLQPGVGWVREPQPFQRLVPPVAKPLKRLKWSGHRPSPG